MLRLSIIVPFYGVEKYIGQCLESLFSQDLPADEYEVICVNDCSPDNSEQIVLDYQSRHDNLVLIRHEVNKKLGAARNTGLKAAKGEYVWFVDSDDYVQENCLRKIVEVCESNDLDVFHWSIKDNHNNWLKQFEESNVTTGIDDLLSGSRDMTFPWNRVYKREFLLEHDLWFNDLWGGDVIHTICSLNCAERMKNSSECYYYYRMDNMSSDMRSPVTANKVVSFCYVLGRAMDDSRDQLSPRLYSLMDECVEWRINQSYKLIFQLPIKEKRLFYHTMKENGDLKSYILVKANSKVRFLLCNPFIAYVIHPFYGFFRSLRGCFRKLLT